MSEFEKSFLQQPQYDPDATQELDPVDREMYEQRVALDEKIRQNRYHDSEATQELHPVNKEICKQQVALDEELRQKRLEEQMARKNSIQQWINGLKSPIRSVRVYTNGHSPQ